MSQDNGRGRGGRPPSNGVWKLQAALAGKAKLDPQTTLRLRRLQDAVARDLGFDGVADMPVLAQGEVVRWSFTHIMALRLMQSGLSLGWNVVRSDGSMPDFLSFNLLAFSNSAGRIAERLGLKREPRDVTPITAMMDQLKEHGEPDGSDPQPEG